MTALAHHWEVDGTLFDDPDDFVDAVKSARTKRGSNLPRDPISHKPRPRMSPTPLTDEERTWLGSWVRSHRSLIDGQVTSLSDIRGCVWVYSEHYGFYLEHTRDLSVLARIGDPAPPEWTLA